LPLFAGVKKVGCVDDELEEDKLCVRMGPVNYFLLVLNNYRRRKMARQGGEQRLFVCFGVADFFLFLPTRFFLILANSFLLARTHSKNDAGTVP